MKRPIWQEYDRENGQYVPRCSVCGYFKKELKTHWFFTGLYCVTCIYDVLWANVRNFKEMEK